MVSIIEFLTVWASICPSCSCTSIQHKTSKTAFSQLARNIQTNKDKRGSQTTNLFGAVIVRYDGGGDKINEVNARTVRAQLPTRRANWLRRILANTSSQHDERKRQERWQGLERGQGEARSDGRDWPECDVDVEGQSSGKEHARLWTSLVTGARLDVLNANEIGGPTFEWNKGRGLGLLMGKIGCVNPILKIRDKMWTLSVVVWLCRTKINKTGTRPSCISSDADNANKISLTCTARISIGIMQILNELNWRTVESHFLGCR